MATRVHTHSPLPAPALHANVVTTQSKSHVLAGVQDAYWSDDEAEDAECPLCLEEMDISDLGFKPCPCGYQICRFCWNHIKQNLNARCPACRREYTDEAVQFKPINKEDHKRLTQQKKQRERERKELDALNRRHLANVRVVQRNVVYVVGMGPRFAKEELIPTLRSNEYFGQYGKISKIVIVKRTSSGGRTPVVGLYITYHRREDAARCISAVDGAPSPGGGHDIMRASHGTTKYCMAFLRGVTCTDHSCMNLHEWGDEHDCFTKEDLTTLKHTMKDTENRARTTTVTSKLGDSEAGLPRAASWANRGANSLASAALHNNTNTNHPLPSTTRPARRTGASTRQQRSGSTTAAPNESKARERKGGTMFTTTTSKAPSASSSSRPATPVSTSATTRTATSATVKASKHKELSSPPPPPPVPSSPAVSTAVESDVGSGSQNLSPLVSQPVPASREVSLPPAPALPPGIPVIPPGFTPPPGLSAPPGLPAPTRPPMSSVASSSLINSQMSQSSYQMSTQAQALVEDIRARRESTLSSVGQSPFPDFDRMLQSLSGGDSGFSFNLDPKLAGDDQDVSLTLQDLEVEAAAMPFSGTFLDAFPGLRQTAQSPLSTLMPPPGPGYPPATRPAYDTSTTRSPVVERQPTGSSMYTGSFNPFATENNDETPSRRYSPLDEERKVSRFGFARGRQGSSSSPLHAPSPLSHSDSLSSHMPYYSASEVSSPVNHSQGQWAYPNRPHHQDYSHHQPNSAMSSPLAQHAQPAQMTYTHQQSPQPTRFQPFDNGVSEAQLREFITSSRDRANSARAGPTDPQAYKYNPNQPFSDPAIMSARLASPMMSQAPVTVQHDGFANPPPSMDGLSQAHQLAYGPPPGLVYPPGIMPGRHGIPTMTSFDVSQVSGSAHVSTSTSPVPSPALSSADFPALPAAEASSTKQQSESSAAPSPAPTVDSKEQAKAERKAAKKAAAAERAAERARIAQEKAAAKAVEKERLAQEKAIEKEKAALLKAEKEKAAREKAAQEKAAKEKADQEKAEREKVEKARLEKENVAQVKATINKTGKQTAGLAVTGKNASPAPVQQLPKAGNRRNQNAKQNPAPTVLPSEPVQAPILAKMPKKNKPVTKPIKIPKEEPVDSQSALVSAATSEAPQFPDARPSDSISTNSSSHSADRTPPNEPVGLEEMLADIDAQVPWMHVPKHPFFDMMKINPAAKMPLEYGPLVHALSALSVGGGSFANNMPSGSIDNAVSSFQQLLETLTQTISDLLRLLPRTTWDDSSSFDGVLRDMLKGDDFLEDGGDEHKNHAKEDEVAALTMALERRARWMEVQLSKLEELHRDINNAAVRAVLSFNDKGWNQESRGFMPKVGNSLQRFDQMGLVEESGTMRPMTADELEKKLVVAKEAAVFAEAELREAMQRMQEYRPLDEDEW